MESQKRNRQSGLIDSVHAFSALSFDPLALDPTERSRRRFLQKRQILREQKESERQHPESEHRQDAENAAEDQQNGERNPDVARRWLAQPADKPGRPLRQLSFEPGKMPVELHLMIFTDVDLPSYWRDVDE